MWSLKNPTFHVALSANRVVVAQAPAIWPGQAVNFERIDCSADAGAQLWRPALAALSTWLNAQHQKPALHLVLSGRFVRWQLLEWRAELSHPAELEVYAALQFGNTYGKVAQDWQILHSPQPPGVAVPACAIDRALLESLRSACSDSGARLISVTPYFSSAFDRWQSSIKDKISWFGVAEADCLTLALVHNGKFAALRSQRLDSPLRESLPSLLTQMSIAFEVPETKVPVYLVGDGEQVVLPTELPIQWLRTKAQQSPGHMGIRMALGM